MFGQIPSTGSSYVDEQGISISGHQQSRSFNTQDEQSFTAPNALCALRHRQPSVVEESAFPTNEIESDLHDSQTLSPVASYRKPSWSGRLPWVEPTLTSGALERVGYWTFGPHGYLANGSQYTQYHVVDNHASEDFGTPELASFPAVEQTPMLSQVHRLTTSNEILLNRLCDLGSTSTPSESASHSPSYFGTGTEPESIDPFSPMMEPFGPIREELNHAPYAKLIERALLEADGNRMTLKDIYKWFEENTDKANKPKARGWQNSVRHNLSMNGAFTKIPILNTSGKPQKGSMWILEPSAKKNGIQSTTRYRRKEESKSHGKRPRANAHQERSGRRGGRAAKKSAKTGSTLQMHQGSHWNLWDQQHPASPSATSANLPRPYLPTPPLRFSTNESYPDWNGDYTSLPFEGVPRVSNWPMQERPCTHF